MKSYIILQNMAFFFLIKLFVANAEERKGKNMSKKMIYVNLVVKHLSPSLIQT